MSRSKLERSIRDLRLPVQITQRIEDADLILALKSHERRAPPRLREAQAHGVPLHVLKSNTVAQMEGFLRSLFFTSTNASSRRPSTKARWSSTWRQPRRTSPSPTSQSVLSANTEVKVATIDCRSSLLMS